MRRSRPRPKTISGKRLTKAEIRDGIELRDLPLYDRPKTRAECAHGLRPCPFVSCKYHLYLDVTSRGALKLNFPHLEVWELERSCALDVADEGGLNLRELGEVLNLTHERARQIENDGLEVIKRSGVVCDIERVFGGESKFGGAP